MELETLRQIEAEVKRFSSRLTLARERMKQDKVDGYSYTGNKHTGALKRAALDLKMELTKITR